MHQKASKNVTSVSCLNPDGSIGIAGLIPRLIIEGPCTTEIEYTIEIKEERPGNVVFRAVAKNAGKKEANFRGIRWAARPYGPARTPLRYPRDLLPEIFHTENMRGDYLCAGTNMSPVFFEPLENRTVLYGSSEDRPFPGILIRSPESPWRVFAGLCSQDTFHVQFLLRGGAESSGFTLELEETIGAARSLQLPAGAMAHGEWIRISVVETSNWRDAIQQHTDFIYEDPRAHERIALNPLSKQRIWCSWNYDFYSNITEERILRQIPVIKEHFPSVKFIQLDDGYQGHHPSKQRAQIDFLYGDRKAEVNRERFPDGLDGLAKKIRAAGLRPAIWMGLWANETSPMLKDNPDWILLNDSGEPLRFETGAAYFDTVLVLDPSVPGVQDYLRFVCDTVFRKWGYEGIKLDFSSFAFESKRVVFRKSSVTGITLRRQLVQIFREALPPDGFFGWCVVTGTANPFLTAEGADYARVSLDINNAPWVYIEEIARWLASSLLLNPVAQTIRNMDSIGRKMPGSPDHAFNNHPNPTDNEWLTWLDLVAISGGAVEISGDLPQLPIFERERMARCLELCKPAARCWAGQEHLEEGHPPCTFFQELGAHRLAAIFNWSENPRDFTPGEMIKDHFSPTSTLFDAWTDQPVNPRLPLTLAPHSSALFKIVN